MNLQSGFVLAVLLAVIIFADHIGGTEEAGRRLYQIALAATLAFTVASATVAFIEPNFDTRQSLTASFDTGNEDDRLTAQEVSNRSVIANGVRFGAGVIVLLFGIGGMARWSTMPLGFTLGGLLLMFAGGGGNEIFGFSALLSASTRSSRGADVGYLVILIIGLAAVIWYGFNRWEAGEETDTEATQAVQ